MQNMIFNFCTSSFYSLEIWLIQALIFQIQIYGKYGKVWIKMEIQKWIYKFKKKCKSLKTISTRKRSNNKSNIPIEVAVFAQIVNEMFSHPVIEHSIVQLMS